VAWVQTGGLLYLLSLSFTGVMRAVPVACPLCGGSVSPCAGFRATCCRPTTRSRCPLRPLPRPPSQSAQRRRRPGSATGAAPRGGAALAAPHLALGLGVRGAGRQRRHAPGRQWSRAHGGGVRLAGGPGTVSGSCCCMGGLPSASPSGLTEARPRLLLQSRPHLPPAPPWARPGSPQAAPLFTTSSAKWPRGASR